MSSLPRKTGKFQHFALMKKLSVLKSPASQPSALAAIPPTYNPSSKNSGAAPPPPRIFFPPFSPPSRPTPPSAKSPTPSAATSASIKNPWSSDCRIYPNHLFGTPGVRASKQKNRSAKNKDLYNARGWIVSIQGNSEHPTKGKSPRPILRPTTPLADVRPKPIPSLSARQ